MPRLPGGLCAVVLACVGCAHVEARNQFQQSFERSVEGPLSRVEVDTSSGRVRIRGVPGAQVTVTGQVTAHAVGMERARDLAEQVVRTPPVERSGEVLVVGRQHQDWSMFQGFDIDYELVVPPELAVSIDSSSGDVEVQGVRGPVQVNSSSGEVRLTEVGATQVDTSSGDVVLDGVEGNIEVDSSSGNVEIRASPGPRSRWKIDTSSGDVILAVPPSAAFGFHATTSSGEVKTGLPLRVQGTVESDELHGVIGEGPSEAEVKVDTSSGDIELRQQGQPGARASH